MPIPRLHKETSIFNSQDTLSDKLADIAGRVAKAEIDIDNAEGAISLKANAEDVYTKESANALLQAKANKDTLTSEINASADTMRIDADRVDVEGAAIFKSGRLSQSSLDGSYDEIGAAEAAEESAKGYADSAVEGKADKTAAVSEEQAVWLSQPSGTLSVDPPAAWVASRTNVQGEWSLKRPVYAASHPVVFTAKQRKTVSGDVNCTTPVKDDTTTVIDGGHITTGTVDAARISSTVVDAINANVTGTINASKVNASQLVIGQSQVTNLQSDLAAKADSADVPTKVSDLSNDSGYQTTTQVEEAITSKGYATRSQAQGYATDAQDAAAQDATEKADAARAAAVNAASADATTKANAAAKSATDYITAVSGDGIWVTPEDAKPVSGAASSTTTGWHISDVLEYFKAGASWIKLWVDIGVAKLRLGLVTSGHVVLDSTGMDVRSGSTSVASFGSTARIGKSSSYHVAVDSDSVDLMDSSTQLATFGATEFEVSPSEVYGSMKYENKIRSDRFKSIMSKTVKNTSGTFVGSSEVGVTSDEFGTYTYVSADTSTKGVDYILDDYGFYIKYKKRKNPSSGWSTDGTGFEFGAGSGNMYINGARVFPTFMTSGTAASYSPAVKPCLFYCSYDGGLYWCDAASSKTRLN